MEKTGTNQIIAVQCCKSGTCKSQRMKEQLILWKSQEERLRDCFSEVQQALLHRKVGSKETCIPGRKNRTSKSKDEKEYGRGVIEK